MKGFRRGKIPSYPGNIYKERLRIPTPAMKAVEHPAIATNLTYRNDDEENDDAAAARVLSGKSASSWALSPRDIQHE